MSEDDRRIAEDTATTDDGRPSKPPPAENDVPADKGEEEIEEYGSRTDE